MPVPLSAGARYRAVKAARYAMKREVAVRFTVVRTGNFRRVCPILNRAGRSDFAVRVCLRDETHGGV